MEFKGGRGWTWKVESAERLGIFDWRLKEKEGFSTETSEGTEFAERKGYPHPGCFWVQSAEPLENKRVEFLLNAKKCKRMPKGVKRKNLSAAGSDELPETRSRMEGPPTPVFFHKC